MGRGPQLKNGFTRIANEILDEVSRLPLNGIQFRIVLAVWRNTYGFGRKDAELSLSFLAESIRSTKKTVGRELKKLVEDGILTVVDEFGTTKSRRISFNKYFPPVSPDQGTPNQGVPQLGSPPTGVKGVPQSGDEGVPQLGDQKRNIKKIKKNTCTDAQMHSAQCADDLFEQLWKLYPNKKGKGRISQTKKKELMKVGYEKLALCIRRYQRDKPDWQVWQNGSTFFNSGYLDYLDGNYEPVKTEGGELDDCRERELKRRLE